MPFLQVVLRLLQVKRLRLFQCNPTLPPPPNVLLLPSDLPPSTPPPPSLHSPPSLLFFQSHSLSPPLFSF